jgi:hypothetical protein
MWNYAKHFKMNASNISQKENYLCFYWVTFHSLKCTQHHRVDRHPAFQKYCKQVKTARIKIYTFISWNARQKYHKNDRKQQHVYCIRKLTIICHVSMAGTHLCVSASSQPHAMQICRMLILNNDLFCQSCTLPLNRWMTRKGPLNIFSKL